MSVGGGGRRPSTSNDAARPTATNAGSRRRPRPWSLSQRGSIMVLFQGYLHVFYSELAQAVMYECENIGNVGRYVKW